MEDISTTKYQGNYKPQIHDPLQSLRTDLLLVFKQ